MTSYFARVGAGRFLAGELTGGAWATDEQHIAPMTGLIAHEAERHAARRGPDDMVITRISMDILGVLKLAEFDVDVTVVRPGRTIELLEAVVTARGRAAVRARIWRMAGQDTTAVAGGHDEALPHPDGLAPYPLSDVWPGGFISSVDVRPVGEPRPGRARVWITSATPLVAGEQASPLADYVKLIDTANGIAVRESPKQWMFPNLDLTIHLHRQPAGRWVGLDTAVTFGATGVGLTSTVLHDESGPVGRAEQILTVRPI
ncbi:thioesterase family protein [Couchioplanes caeruleus]|uniref:thioesterase family protein n=1 Tax=Couchioplanes caeruleus TaxID=56438 RepID=UPI0020BF9157|nr:thioesterase family protein [Couchioplanes caeruleus]UQU61342.1 thioesterase family protein [Couchioplanes caeruleus]